MTPRLELDVDRLDAVARHSTVVVVRRVEVEGALPGLDQLLVRRPIRLVVEESLVVHVRDERVVHVPDRLDVVVTVDGHAHDRIVRPGRAAVDRERAARRRRVDAEIGAGRVLGAVPGGVRADDLKSIDAVREGPRPRRGTGRPVLALEPALGRRIALRLERDRDVRVEVPIGGVLVRDRREQVLVLDDQCRARVGSAVCVLVGRDEFVRAEVVVGSRPEGVGLVAGFDRRGPRQTVGGAYDREGAVRQRLAAGRGDAGREAGQVAGLERVRLGDERGDRRYVRRGDRRHDAERGEQEDHDEQAGHHRPAQRHAPPAQPQPPASPLRAAVSPRRAQNSKSHVACASLITQRSTNSLRAGIIRACDAILQFAVPLSSCSWDPCCSLPAVPGRPSRRPRSRLLPLRQQRSRHHPPRRRP